MRAICDAAILALIIQMEDESAVKIGEALMRDLDLRSRL